MDGVVLLHGIAGVSTSFAKMERALAASGYLTLNLDYPSRQSVLQDLAEGLHPPISQFLAGLDGHLHFVTHSMGGLVARAYINRHRPAHIGRVVALAPPNGGSEVADLLRGNLFYRRFYGPAGAQLTTAQDAELCAVLGPVNYPLGIIAGDRSVDPVASLFVVPRPNDGRVSVARTRIEGMADHITLHIAHPMMPRSSLVISQTLHFLRRGYFRKTDGLSRGAEDPVATSAD